MQRQAGGASNPLALSGANQTALHGLSGIKVGGLAGRGRERRGRAGRQWCVSMAAHAGAPALAASALARPALRHAAPAASPVMQPRDFI